MFDSEKKTKKEQIEYFLSIKPILQPTANICKVESEGNEFSVKLNELSKRIGSIEEKIEEKKDDSFRKIRIKEQVLSLLGQHKKLSSSELSNLINLSRTRCNEYFRELSKEGLVEGTIVDRQKFYKMVKR